MGMQMTLEGSVAGVYIGDKPGVFESTPVERVNVSFAGFEGDLHAGITHKSDSRTPWYPRGTEIRNNRQVSIVSVEELEEIRRAMGVERILPEWLSINLALEGIPHLTQLPPNTRIVFSSGAVLVVYQENNPCGSAGRAIGKQVGRPEIETLFPKAALHRRGLVAYVELEGQIHRGDSVKVEVPEQVIYQP